MSKAFTWRENKQTFNQLGELTQDNISSVLNLKDDVRFDYHELATAESMIDENAIADVNFDEYTLSNRVVNVVKMGIVKYETISNFHFEDVDATPKFAHDVFTREYYVGAKTFNNRQDAINAAEQIFNDSGVIADVRCRCLDMMNNFLDDVLVARAKYDVNTADGVKIPVYKYATRTLSQIIPCFY